MVALAKSISATTIGTFRDSEAAKLPQDNRTRVLVVCGTRRDAIVARIPEAADLDLIVMSPPKEWLDEQCGY